MAVKKYSQDKATNKNKGILINPYTNDSWFELTRMDPSIYARVDGLNEGELSEVFFDETREGEKMYKVIMLREKVDSHQADLVSDYVKIQQLTLQKKQQDEIRKWNVKHIKDTYVKLSPQLKDCDLEYNWVKDNE